MMDIWHFREIEATKSDKLSNFDNILSDSSEFLDFSKLNAELITRIEFFLTNSR